MDFLLRFCGPKALRTILHEGRLAELWFLDAFNAVCVFLFVCWGVVDAKLTAAPGWACFCLVHCFTNMCVLIASVWRFQERNVFVLAFSVYFTSILKKMFVVSLCYLVWGPQGPSRCYFGISNNRFNHLKIFVDILLMKKLQYSFKMFPEDDISPFRG